MYIVEFKRSVHLKYGCESRPLVIGMSVAICVMPTCKVRSAGVMECWRVGFKSENRSDFCSFTFGFPRSKHGLFFFHYIHHSSIHYPITPIHQIELTSSFDKEGMAAVYQRRLFIPLKYPATRCFPITETNSLIR